MTPEHHCQILHIDDNPREIELMQLALGDADGPQVSYVGITDPIAGVRQLTGDPVKLPSIIMLDLNMPVMGGMQILQQLRGHASYRTVPVIIFTTSQRPADRDRCLALGATAVISKPTSFVDLLDVAKSIKAYC
jgi:CheY-like chemotaxis protein